MPRPNEFLTTALAYADHGIPVTPAAPAIAAPRLRWWQRPALVCSCRATSCRQPGAHPLTQELGSTLSTRHIRAIWDTPTPPNLMISPSATLDIWTAPRELGALAQRLMEAQRLEIWPALMQQPHGGWTILTRRANGPVPHVSAHGSMLRRHGPGDLVTVPPSRRPRCTSTWEWSPRFPHTPLPDAEPVLAALLEAASRLQPWEVRDDEPSSTAVC